MTESTPVDPAHGSPAWAPLRRRVFRVLWFAVLISQLGTWMQVVGAQWLLVDRPNAAILVSLVQTASMLPVLLLALPAGVLADSFDRRRLLISVQCFQLVVATALAALTGAGEMSPALLLTLTFALGCGTAMTVPTYQAVIPELVPRAELPSASALGAISMNVARAVGPAIAGLIVARSGPATVFALNAATFAVFAGAVLWWRRPVEEDTPGAERFIAALRTGGRYVRHSPMMRRFLLRLGLFVVPGTALWALLPLVAADHLHLGAGGYGLLLGALGVGAVCGALVLPRFSAAVSGNALLAAATGTYAAATAAAALVPVPALTALALVPAGAAWVTVLSTANADVSMFLPRWIRARGLASYQVVFLGSQAIGALAWGLLADAAGLAPALLVAAALSGAAAMTVRLWPIPGTRHLDRDPASYWDEPQLATDPDPSDGPIVVEVSYQVDAANTAEFLKVMEFVRRSRMRTGAVRWGIFADGERPGRLVELYVVPTWGEHLGQHYGRLTGTDREVEERARGLADGQPDVVHLLPPPR